MRLLVVDMEEEAHDYCRFMFMRVMECLNRDSPHNAVISFVGDCDKSGNNNINLGELKMFFLLKKNTAEDVIKWVCGYSWMPTDIQQYYKKPDKAFEDYKK